jgi:hypothetical protein
LNNGNRDRKILYLQTKAFLIGLEKEMGIEPYAINQAERHLLSIVRGNGLSPAKLARLVETLLKEGQLDANKLT